MKYIPLVALLFLVACGGGPAVQSDFNPMVDFTTYRSFRFEEPRPGAKPEGIDPRVRTTIRKAIREDLATKSLAEVPSDADLSIAILIAVGEQAGSAGTAYYWDPRGGTEGGDRYVISEGTLIIDFYEGVGGQRVWRSVAQGAAGRTDDPDLEYLERVVLTMLAEYPPATGES